MGIVYEFMNLGTVNFTVNTGGTQLVNLAAAKTSLTGAPGAAVKMTAAKSNEGTLFWYARVQSMTV